ncbi:uncharacterized protein EI97DRAFT_122360 [Westerdykella ornata]|uniref:Uncharacterized protein n=1 Tax=Westerdykella ornata TaxID=318751 RepID=A0A6A6JW17_WESOR|nr:uncharacterized protein EI97DRAFT_122360 [Westerdykella ornata]KAF2280404.1 hypothetical protein EI97DRAFT_122360 [Westerdykella ornata]
MLPNLDKISPWPHRCRVKRDTMSRAARLASIIRTVLPMSSAAQRYTPPCPPTSSTTTGQASPSAPIPQINADPDQFQRQQAAITIQLSPGVEDADTSQNLNGSHQAGSSGPIKIYQKTLNTNTTPDPQRQRILQYPATNSPCISTPAHTHVIGHSFMNACHRSKRPVP